MIVEVIRPLPGPDGLIPPGTRLSTADWPVRRADQLMRFRYVAPVVGEPAPAGHAAPAVPPKRGPGRPPKARPAEEAIP